MVFLIYILFLWNSDSSILSTETVKPMNEWEINEERTWQTDTDMTSFAPLFSSLNSPLDHYKKSGHLPAHAVLNEMSIYCASVLCVEMHCRLYQHALHAYLTSIIGLQMQRTSHIPLYAGAWYYEINHSQHSLKFLPSGCVHQVNTTYLSSLAAKSLVS